LLGRTSFVFALLRPREACCFWRAEDGGFMDNHEICDIGGRSDALVFARVVAHHERWQIVP
jgi:hypothetical protein